MTEQQQRELDELLDQIPWGMESRPRVVVTIPGHELDGKRGVLVNWGEDIGGSARVGNLFFDDGTVAAVPSGGFAFEETS